MKITLSPYVKIIKNHSSCFTKGEILKTELISKGSHKNEYRFVWPDNSGQIFMNDHKGIFISATKEEYDRQFINNHKPIVKEDLSYLKKLLKNLT